MSIRNNKNLDPAYTPLPWLFPILLVAIVLGVIGFAIGAIVGPGLDAWLWLLLGFLLFGGIAQGMLTWAAVFRAAQARWTPAVNRLGHSGIAFLPFSLLTLLILLFGVHHWAPWTEEPIPAKAAWLNIPFMVIRDLLGVGGLAALGFLLVRGSLMADEKMRRGEAISQWEQSRLTGMAIAQVITYAVVFTIVSWDFIMSLSPEWYSTMFGAYYFMTNLYVSMAVTILLAQEAVRASGGHAWLGRSQFHDMGNLLLGFALFCMGLFFAQYLTIWYENLPEETFFLIPRYLRPPWAILGWISFILGYAIPFVLLIPRHAKLTPWILRTASILAIIGVALERYVLVVPSLAPHRLLISPLSGLILLSFAGLFLLAITWFRHHYAPVSSAEAALPELETLDILS